MTPPFTASSSTSLLLCIISRVVILEAELATDFSLSSYSSIQRDFFIEYRINLQSLNLLFLPSIRFFSCSLHGQLQLCRQTSPSLAWHVPVYSFVSCRAFKEISTYNYYLSGTSSLPRHLDKDRSHDFQHSPQWEVERIVQNLVISSLFRAWQRYEIVTRQSACPSTIA